MIRVIGLKRLAWISIVIEMERLVVLLIVNGLLMIIIGFVVRVQSSFIIIISIINVGFIVVITFTNMLHVLLLFMT